MVNQQLLNPRSIVVVGGSDDIQKPGGKVLKNLVDNGFKGKLYVVNPKLDEVQGVKTFRDVANVPEVDLAILAIAAKFCPGTVEVLTKQKSTRAFIILSAGFHGLMYFGNEGMILEYDGHDWRDIPIKDDNIQSLCNGSGVIYFGGTRSFGVIKTDVVGNHYAFYLSERLGRNVEVNNIWKTYSIEGKIFFCSLKRIFIYDPKADVIQMVELPKNSFLAFVVNNQLLVGNWEQGLLTLHARNPRFYHRVYWQCSWPTSQRWICRKWSKFHTRRINQQYLNHFPRQHKNLHCRSNQGLWYRTNGRSCCNQLPAIDTK